MHDPAHPAGPALHYDAIKLMSARPCLLTPPGVFDASWRFILTQGHRWDAIRMQRCVESGLDFEHSEISMEKAQQAT